MKMDLNTDWLRFKASLEAAVRIDSEASEAWLAQNEEFAMQTLSVGYLPRTAAIRMGDLIEKHVGLYADPGLPNPPDDTAHYKRWVHMNCFRLRERMDALKIPSSKTFSWLNREYLRQHGRLVK